MLKQLADQSKKKKLQKLDEFRVQLEEELKSAESFKSDHPDREDLNALIELILAIEEEAKAVADLVEIDEDCAEDWLDLEDARSSLKRTQDRIQHQNWIELGPSRSRRINLWRRKIKCCGALEQRRQKRESATWPNRQRRRS